ncbi:MAG: MCE family protein, partial [Planctomycetales bacterium]|nr:MCE family protein [Planctomycetales bacterium]
MDERVLQFRVGVMVFSSVLIAGFLVILFYSNPNLFGGRYTLYVKFNDAPGVEKETPVRKSGVLIGRVTDVQLRDEDVLVTMRIDTKYKIYQNEVCQISTESLLGDPVLEFIAARVGQPPGDPVESGEYMHGSVKAGPLEAMESVNRALETVQRLESDVRASLTEFQAAAGSVKATSNEMHTLLSGVDDDSVKRIVLKTETALDQFQLAMAGINSVVGDPETRMHLKQSLEGVPELIGETRLVLQKYGGVADRVNKVLDDTGEFTASLNRLGQASDGISGNIDRVSENLDRLILDLLTVSDAVKNQEGTIGKLVYDDELYNRLNGAAGNVELVTHRLRPIVEDVRVFTDKIARDPGQLGVRGVFQRGATGSKFLPISAFAPEYGAAVGQEYHWTPPPAPCDTYPAPTYERPAYETHAPPHAAAPAAGGYAPPP